MSVQWDDGSEVCRVAVSLNDTCSHVYDKVVEAVPRLKEEDFCFAAEQGGTPIHAALWDIVYARKLGSPIYIMKGVYDFVKRAQQSMVAEVVHNYAANGEHQLPLAKGDRITVLHMETHSTWAFGQHKEDSGWFPKDRIVFKGAHSK